MREICITVGEHTKYEIRLTAISCGDDWSVTICGGTRHHVGAVALGCGGSVNGISPKYSASVSVITVFDHKDDEIARRAAKLLATKLRCQVCVTAGIHIDDAKPEELKILAANCEEAYTKLLAEIDMSANEIKTGGRKT